ncbi:abscission/NoCut checkpoint regulator [Cydia pomonella]|uniref:abscission/NoCut checkpoint regulator n=1 Tax=Cydia pomonella TaxID=82600 RepID=UPI002ADD982B|nr:abscission/NoCut checkpoint regulator [Cydia pomonella]
MSFYEDIERIGAGKDNSSTGSSCNRRIQNDKDQEIQARLQKLKENEKVKASEEEISRRLQNIKGEVPTTSDAELLERLAKLRGVPVATLQTKAVLVAPDTRSEQEQADDLLKQYQAKTAIDTKYTDEFNGLVTDMESRLQSLKGNGGPSQTHNVNPEDTPSEDEEDTIKKIIERLKTEALLDEQLSPTSNDELPFCEICNEDATMRCVGCQYLFCKRCFLDHKDDDDGCDRYEPYTPPNRTSV